LLQIQRDVQQRYADELAQAEVTHALFGAMQRARRAELTQCVSARTRVQLRQEA
jgi:hypothetical protein